MYDIVRPKLIYDALLTLLNTELYVSNQISLNDNCKSMYQEQIKNNDPIDFITDTEDLTSLVHQENVSTYTTNNNQKNNLNNNINAQILAEFENDDVEGHNVANFETLLDRVDVGLKYAPG